MRVTAHHSAPRASTPLLTAGRTVYVSHVKLPAVTSFLLGAVTLGLGGCSLALDFEQCVDDAECAGRSVDGMAMRCAPEGYCEPLEGESGPSDVPPRIAFVYVGPVGDHGWTKTHDDSRLYLEQQISDVVTFYEPLVTPSDAPGVIDNFIQNEGATLVIGTSFDFLGPIQQAAANNPDVDFLTCSGFLTGPNLGSYFARMYMPQWLAGRLAAQMSATGKLGIVGSVVIPETVRHANAFLLGARSVNPEATVMIRWINRWFDVEAEEAATQELIDNGADVLFSGTDTPTALTVADGQMTPAGDPVYTFGYDNPDSCKFAPSTCLTSLYYNWGPMVEAIVNDIQGGTWSPEVPVWEPMRGDEARSGASISAINENIVEIDKIIDIEQKRNELANGEFLVFPPNVVDNSGNVRLDGRAATDDDLLEMCWFVDGMIEPHPTETTPAVVPGGCGGVY